MNELIRKLRANWPVAIAIAFAACAFLGIIVWFYTALDSQMQALEAGITGY